MTKNTKTTKPSKMALDERLASLDEKFAKMVSLKEGFKQGVVRGIGTAIGASIIAAALLSTAAYIVDRYNDLPLIDIAPIEDKQ